MENKISLIVISCDKYKDLWPIFEHYFNKNWPNCKLNKFIISNFEESNSKIFNSITVGDDKSWSENLKKALQKIKTPYVFLMLDDVFINEIVNNHKFEKILEEFINLKGNYLKFLTHPKSKIKSKSIHFNTLPKGTLYRSTAVFTAWNIKTLQEILVKSESPWEFEEYASMRSDKYDGFYVVRKNFFKYLHGVVKSKFLYSSFKYIMKNDNEISEYIKREINSPFEEKLQLFKNLRHYIFYALVPLKSRRIVKQKIKYLFDK